jgi:4-amino-4-deoxy-L-arabinose transferase-like glycosyltransferase
VSRIGNAPLVWLIVLATAVRLLMAHAIGLGVDESYMVAAGRTLHISYFDHPPISWWLSWGAARLFDSEAPVVVRLPFILLGAASTWMVARLGAELGGRAAGFWTALAYSCAPVLGFTSASWVLPDGPLDAALLAMALCLVRALRSTGWRWWLAAGVAAGLAMLSKYSAVLPIAGGLVYLLTQKQDRRWLARPQPWVAVAVAALMFTPVIVWNAEHGWASLAFQGNRADAVRLQPFGPLVVLAGEALFLLPWIWAPLMLVWLRALRGGLDDRPRWLFACLGAGPVLLFAIVALWSRHVLFHWAAPGYLLLLPLLGEALARWDGRALRRVAAGTVALLLAGLAVVAIEVRWNPLPLPHDPALQAVDFTPLRAVLASRGLLGQPVAAPNWSDAGRIGYALGGAPPVMCLNTDAREFGFAPGPASVIGQNILIVAPRSDEARIRAGYAAIFESIETLPPAVIDLPGRPGHRVPLFIGHTLRRWPP